MWEILPNSTALLTQNTTNINTESPSKPVIICELEAAEEISLTLENGT
jgi:hypothetical protein